MTIIQHLQQVPIKSCVEDITGTDYNEQATFMRNFYLQGGTKERTLLDVADLMIGTVLHSYRQEKNVYKMGEYCRNCIRSVFLACNFSAKISSMASW